MGGQKPGQIIDRADPVGPTPQRFSKMRDGLIDFILIGQDTSEIIVCLGEAGLELYRPTIAADCFIELALRLQLNTDVEVSIGVLGLDLQRRMLLLPR